MITFHDITLDDREWMEPKFREDARQNCENSFANNFMWRQVYHVKVADVENCAVIEFEAGGERCFSYPIGNGRKEKAIQLLMQYCQQEQITLHMSPLSEKDRAELITWFPGKFLLQADRDSFDYIYTVEKLTKLSGKKLHGKRNHIARFKDGDDWSYEPLTIENIPDCRQMTIEWTQMREDKWNDEMSQEMMVLEEAFSHFTELGLSGGVLRKAGEIVAFCVGEPLSEDTFVVHFEKAFPEMQGAYPMINQQFIEHTCQAYTYVNREEDTGDLGLRKAKLSYYPELLLKKYAARQSGIVFADPETDRDGIQKLWQICFGDEEEYIDFYIQKRMTKDNMLTIWQDGKVVSMASFLPAEYVSKNGERIPVRYVYAVATLPEYRGRGYAEQILMFAGSLWGEALVLCPAEESLYGYYQRMGFVKAFGYTDNAVKILSEETGNESEPQTVMAKGSMWETDSDAAGNRTVKINDYYIEAASAAKYKEIRNRHFANPGALLWDEAAIQYAMDSNACFDGRAVITGMDQEMGREEDTQMCNQEILMYNIEEDELNILETTMQEQCLKMVLADLMAENHVSQVRLQKHQGMILPCGNMKPEDIVEHGYLNLVLA